MIQPPTVWSKLRELRCFRHGSVARLSGIPSHCRKTYKQAHAAFHPKAGNCKNQNAWVIYTLILKHAQKDARGPKFAIVVLLKTARLSNVPYRDGNAETLRTFQKGTHARTRCSRNMAARRSFLSRSWSERFEPGS